MAPVPGAGQGSARPPHARRVKTVPPPMEPPSKRTPRGVHGVPRLASGAAGAETPPEPSPSRSWAHDLETQRRLGMARTVRLVRVMPLAPLSLHMGREVRSRPVEINGLAVVPSVGVSPRLAAHPTTSDPRRDQLTVSKIASPLIAGAVPANPHRVHRPSPRPRCHSGQGVVDARCACAAPADLHARLG